MKKTIEFGKIDFNGNGRKNCLVTVDVELRKQGGQETFTVDSKGAKTYTGKKTPLFYEFSVCGSIWNPSKTDTYCSGQCLDEIAKYIKNPLFIEIYGLWKKYHLNGLHAGTPEQEEAIKKMGSRQYNYKTVCEYLKNIDLYEVMYTGLSVGRIYENELYKYGTAWLVQEIPESDLLRIKEIINMK